MKLVFLRRFSVTDMSWSCVCVLSCFSRIQLFATLWTVCSLPVSSVHGILQARILEWRLPCSPPGDLPDPGIQRLSQALPTLAGGFFTTRDT